MSWTEDRVEKLTKLWADGLSASQIAAQLGGVSRNAVIGKVHRLHLPGRAKSGGSSTARAKRTATIASKSTSYTTRSTVRSSVGRSVGATALKADISVEAFQRVDNRPIEDVVIPISRELTLTQLSEKTCRWPLGDPLTDDFHFCGTDCSDSTPYCTYHSKLAFQPTSERRRSR